MQEKALVAHLELHKKVVKNAWILSYEGRKVLVIEFQETVNFILQNTEAAAAMAENGCRYVKEHFAWDVIVKKYTEFFKMFD